MKRKFPKFVGTGIPLLATWSNAVQWGNVINGCVPILNDDRERDPDIPIPSYSNIFTHPGMAGLMLRRVSSPKELFHMGSSFVLARSGASSSGCNMLAFIGARAEEVLVRGRAQAPAWCDQSVNSGWPSVAVTQTMIDKFPTSAYTEASNVSRASGYGTTSVTGMTTGVNAAPLLAPLPDARLFTQSSIALSLGLVPRSEIDIRVDLAAGHADIGKWTVMAIMTDADDGALCVPVSNVGAPATVDKYLGFVSKQHQFGTIRSINGPHKEIFLNGAPSDTRKYLREAWDYEMKLSGDVPLTIGYGCTWASRTASTSITGVARYERSFGWLAPLVCPGGDFAQNSITGYTADHPASAAAPYWAIQAADIEGEQEPIAQTSLCWALGTINAGDLIPKAAAYFQSSYPIPLRLTADEIIKMRGLAYEGQFDTAAIQAAAVSVSTVFDQGTPQQVSVPSLDTNFVTKSPFTAFFGLDPLTYGAIKKQRDFYRRIYKRAEDLARKDG